MRLERISPVTGRVASSATAMTTADARAVADRAEAGFRAWADMGPNARRAVLSKAAEAIEQRRDEFVQAMTDEVGATAGWAMFNLMLAASMTREAAALTTRIGGEVIPSDKPGCLAMSVREPVGVLLGIAPWNAPIILGVRAIAAPLACGNAVILKASELCPRTHELIIEAFAGAGFPEGVVNLVTNDPKDAGEVVGALIDHPAVRCINFTGSTAVGRVIARRCAEQLKPCLLELGGKASLIVLEDANLDEADAIRVANDSEYGLSAAVFTGDAACGLRVARQIRSGMCHINGSTVHDEAQMPFGGVGASGYGRFGGAYGPLFVCDLAFAAEKAPFGLSEVNNPVIACPAGEGDMALDALIVMQRPEP